MFIRSPIRSRFFTTALLLAQAGTVWAQTDAAAEPSPQGRWITESGNLEVEIAPCNAALCGKVVRVIANRSMSPGGAEMAPVDTRPALGLQILSDLHTDGDGTWDGRIYNREKAKDYSVQVRMDGPQQLLVRGYVGLPLFGKTQLWHRVAATPEAH